MILYNNRHVPDHLCPICKIPLIVNEKVNEREYPPVKRRLVCPNWPINGCSYKEKWTPEIEASLIKIEAEAVEVEVDF